MENHLWVHAKEKKAEHCTEPLYGLRRRWQEEEDEVPSEDIPLGSREAGLVRKKII